MAKKMPDFKNEQEENEFWKTHDVREYINWEKADAFVNRLFQDKKTEMEILKELKKTKSTD